MAQPGLTFFVSQELLRLGPHHWTARANINHCLLNHRRQNRCSGSLTTR
ncbi:MAG: hypothetical protein HS126_03375 [Anaerolineales bacterium]|nr:hypothetical protein [Anaerolineales bacterium]